MKIYDIARGDIPPLRRGRAPRQDGMEWIGDREVPCWVPAIGQSPNEAAKALGLRLLKRREEGDVVACVTDGDGNTFRAVKASA